MSYEPGDEAWDDFYSSLSEELYPEHKAQAISEFTRDRLRSFYLMNPDLMVPALAMYMESKVLWSMKRPTPTVVFYMTTLELLLKATLLKPIVYGLVHNEGLAGLIVEHALGQTGLHRYKGLLAKIYQDLTGLDISKVSRTGSSMPLLDESLELQKIRNKIIHQGDQALIEEANRSKEIVSEAFDSIVHPILLSLGLKLIPGGSGKISGA